MKIVVLQDYLRSGGTERQSVLLADAFAGLGHDTTLLRFRPGGPLAPSLVRAKTASLQRFDTGLDWFAPGLIRRLRGLEPELILCMGRMANCRGGALQDALPQTQVVSTLRTGKSLPWLYRRSLHRTKHTVANSKDACRVLLERHHLRPEQVSVINNSLVFKPDNTRAEQRRLREEMGANTNTLVLLSVAMFRPEKNQRELIELCTLLPKSLDWQLWLAGDGPCLADCVHRVEELNLASRIRFLGFTPDPSAAYAGADLAVHTSVSEALSNFLIEAQSHGLPCVAYEAQGNEECIIPSKTGFIIRQGDRRAFVEAILSLAAEPVENRKARSSMARSFARTSFDESRQVKAYLDLFARLLHEGKRGNA